MVAIAPFRALRYNLERVGDLSAVVAPPYDVISPEQQAQLYRASPYNMVRLILGRRTPADTDADNWYTRAKQAFEAWQAQGVLMRDAQPALYLYEHEFGEGIKRLGCVALLSLEEASIKQVLAHESTFEGPKADRAKLLDTLPANLSPIFCLTPDPQHERYALMRQWADAHPPLATAQVSSGKEQARIWAITDRVAIEQFQRLMAPMRLLIADGHHRFSVAVAHRHRFGAVMIYISCLDDPAVRVRPIHRVMRVPKVSPAQWLERLEALCTFTPATSSEALTRWLQSQDAPGCFGCYVAGQHYQVHMRHEALATVLLRPDAHRVRHFARPRWPSLRPMTHAALASLDVTLLHHVLVPHLHGQASPNGLELRSSALPSPTPPSAGCPGSVGIECVYTPDASEAVAMVDCGAGDGAWLLRGLPMAHVLAIAQQGVMLPQKTTYFYPKLLSGLFINPFE